MSRVANGQMAAAPERAGIPHVPHLCFLIAAVAILGTAAFHSAQAITAEGPNRDIWQHAAALLALMENLGDPSNPFVATEETSRHFHPLWMATAAIGRAFDLTVWQLLTGVSYLSMALLALGMHLFARSYFRAPYAPLILLLTLTAGWLIQPQHTGFHAFQTLMYGAPYPATVMIGAALVLWALTIRALEASQIAAALAPALLAGVMFTTHQLGAVMALIGAAAFVLSWPEVALRRRVAVALAGVGGLGLSFAWPYYTPLGLILTPGNSSWEGGFPFYNPQLLAILLIPAALGCLGLRGARARALVVALVAFALIFLVGLTGPQVAGRFLMPIALVLQIGLAGLFLRVIARGPRAVPAAVTLVAVGVLVPLWVTMSVSSFEARSNPQLPPGATYYDAARALTADIPDTEEIAAANLLAWPVVGTGQRVLSVPWPEPGISDLSERQSAMRALIDPSIPVEARIALAGDLGVRTLLVSAHARDSAAIRSLTERAVATRVAGPYLRIDLAE